MRSRELSTSSSPRAVEAFSSETSEHREGPGHGPGQRTYVGPYATVHASEVLKAMSRGPHSPSSCVTDEAGCRGQRGPLR